jgi:hypothetical protein
MTIQDQIDVQELSDLETLVEMRDADNGNDEDSDIAEKW